MSKTKNVSMEPLAKLIVLLNNGQPISPTRIMSEMGGTRKTAHDRLNKLEELGCKFETTELREGARGPTVKGYEIVINRAAKKIVREHLKEISKDFNSFLAA